MLNKYLFIEYGRDTIEMLLTCFIPCLFMKTNLFLVSRLTVLLNKQFGFLLWTLENAMDGVSLFSPWLLGGSEPNLLVSSS